MRTASARNHIDASHFLIGLFGCSVKPRGELLRTRAHCHTGGACGETRGHTVPAACAPERHGPQSSGAVSLHKIEFIGAGKLVHRRKRSPVSAEKESVVWLENGRNPGLT